MSPRLNFEALFNASPNAYVLLDPDFTIVEANEAYLQVTGRDREDIIGRNMFDAFPGDPDVEDSNAQRLRASFEQVLSTGERDSLALIPYTIPQKTAEGEPVHEERYWSATHTPVFDEDEEVAFIFQHTTDVTELYETKEELRTAEENAGTGRSQIDRKDHSVGKERAEKSPQTDTPRNGTESASKNKNVARQNRSSERIPTKQIEEGIYNRAKEVQKAYWTSEEEREHLRRLFDQAPGFMTFVRGPEYVFEMANEAYYQVIGHRDIIGKSVREALPEVEEQGFIGLLDQVYESREPFVGREVEIQLERTPGEALETVYLDFIYQPVTVSDGSVVGIFVQGHDVTEKKEAMDQLRHQQSQLEELNETLEERVEERTRQVRELTSRVTMAEQRERRRIARLLHDDLQQQLYGSQLKISSLLARLQKMERAEIAEQIEEVEGEIEAIIRRVRRLAVGMSPPILQSEGLTAALEWLQSHMKKTRELTVHLSADGEFPMEEEMRVLLFQVTRELLINVAKHADVRRAEVELREEAGDLLIKVIDEGQGFDPEDVERLEPEEAFGLIAVRERVRPFGGRLEINAVPGEGTEVRVHVPMETAQAETTSAPPEDKHLDQ